MPLDLTQWKALVLTGLRIDWRVGGAAAGLGGRASGGAKSVAGVLMLDVAVGSVLAVTLVFVPDVYLAGMIYICMLVFTVGSTVILDFHAIVLSPVDHALLAYQPVSSRTFLAARLTTVSAYVLVMAGATALPPIVAAAFAADNGVILALVVAWSTVLASLGMTFALIGLYAWILTSVKPARVRAALTALQLVLASVWYGALVLLPATSTRWFASIGGIRPGWAGLVNPVAWFASWFALLEYGPSAVVVTGMALSLAFTAASVWVLTGRLSLDYAERIAQIDAGAAAGAARGPFERWLFTRGEARAVARLIAAQFRFDLTFRLGVLSIVPLTIVYLFSGLATEGAHGGHFARIAPMFIAVLSFPAVLYHLLVRSDSWKAAWIFYAAPASGVRLVLALRRCLMTWFMIPYVLFLAVLLACLGVPLALLPGMGIVVLLAGLAFLNVAMLLRPRLPFSVPPQRADEQRRALVFVAILIASAVLAPHLLDLVLASLPATLAAVGGLAALNFGLDRALGARIERLLAGSEFEA